LSKVFIPDVYLAPRWRDPHWSFTKIFGVRKLESVGYHAMFFARWYV